MYHRSTQLLLASLLASASATPAFAQSTGSNPEGPSLSLAVDTSYISNVTRSSEAQAAVRGLSRDDVRITPSINADIIKTFGRHTATLAGGAGYDFNLRNKRLNSERINLVGRLAFDLPICDTDVSANFARNQSDLGQFGVFADDATTDNTETITGGRVALNCGGIVGIRPTGSIGYQRGTNTNIFRQIRNNETWIYSGGLAYQSPVVGDISLFIQRSEARYINETLPDGRNIEVTSTSYGAGFERDIGARLRGGAQISYVNTDSNRPGVASFNGLNWSLDATVLASSRLQFVVATSRALSTSLAIDADYNIASTYSVSANYALTSLVRLNAGYSHVDRTFVGSRALFGTPLTQDARDQFNIGAAYSRGSRLRFRLDGAREQRTGGGPEYDFVDYRALFGVDYSL